jgi:endonuclease/exonuclease/phosphatase family metal-dependent hydrolase
MTFNVRNGRAVDGRHSWCLRRRSAAELLAGLDPDMVGLQEAYRFQERYLLDALPSFDSDGEGRAGSGRGERCSLLWRTDAIDVVDVRTRWFSEDPERPGSRLPTAAHPRIATLAHAVNRPSGRAFGVANTHLDHQHQANRERSVQLLLSWLDGDLPWVVLGDLNARPDSAVLRRLAEAGLRSALPTDAPGTVHGFSGRTDGPRIDHILVSAGWEVVDAKVVQEKPRGRLPSDHWPVVADLRLRD